MIARITIHSGIAAGTSHPIDGRVARVGSDPQSDVCVPTNDVPEHALTLEFRDEACLVYNRCRDSVFIGGRTIEPDQIAEWPDTDILQLGKGTELLLDFGSHEESMLYDADEGLDDADLEDNAPPSHETTPEADAKSGNSKLIGQLCVIVFCVLGCVLLLVRDQNRKSAPEAGPTFGELVTLSRDSADVAPELVQRIQYAEAQRVRGREEDANREFQSIRDDLLAQRDQPQEDLNESNSQILQFIQSRLAADR